jgi:hypothetical protein
LFQQAPLTCHSQDHATRSRKLLGEHSIDAFSDPAPGQPFSVLPRNLEIGLRQSHLYVRDRTVEERPQAVHPREAEPDWIDGSDAGTLPAQFNSDASPAANGGFASIRRPME